VIPKRSAYNAANISNGWVKGEAAGAHAASLVRDPERLANSN
jgi:hypothetical protein